jgi:hypothetical protein
MKKFDRVKQYLEDAVNGDDIGVHGNFWRALDLGHFKTFVVQVTANVQLLVVGNGTDSNLIKALEGRAPFGKDMNVAGAVFNRMPDPDAGYSVMAPDRIKYIKDWIDAGCPDEDEPVAGDAGSRR